MKTLLYLFLILIISCKKEPPILHFKNGSAFEAQENISYGNHTDEKLDLYLPIKYKNPKLVFLFVHGGGWKGGDKSEATTFLLSMMEKFPNAVFVNINYQLASESTFAIPTQTDDVEKAIQFINKKTKTKNQYILLGNSSGAHICMLFAYHFNQNQDIKAVVNLVGPANLKDEGFKQYFDYPFVEKKLINPKIIPKNIDKIDFASPVFWIKETTVPTISFYGNADNVVPSTQIETLDSAFNKNKILHKNYIYNGGHADWKCEKNISFVTPNIQNFLKNID